MENEKVSMAVPKRHYWTQYAKPISYHPIYSIFCGNSLMLLLTNMFLESWLYALVCLSCLNTMTPQSVASQKGLKQLSLVGRLNRDLKVKQYWKHYLWN